jgi:Family of unknown function (DUF5694)
MRFIRRLQPTLAAYAITAAVLIASGIGFSAAFAAPPAAATPPGPASSSAAASDRDAEIMLVATYHLSNPGQDLHNVKADDVLAPRRQEEVRAIVAALARFEPTFVGVEWPANVVEERYPKYLAGTLPESRNEVVQLGFRLAKQLGIAKVHGLDVDGDFPFEAVMTWAKANGQTATIDALMALGQQETARISTMQETGTIGSILRYMNEPASVELNHSFYPVMLRMGSGNEQPGVALLSSWYQRNLAICARLLQAVRPGERAVVFYGQGHAYLINQCIDEAPGAKRVDPLGWLP